MSVEDSPDAGNMEDFGLTTLDDDEAASKKENKSVVDHVIEVDGRKIPNIDFVLDIPMTISAELGRTTRDFEYLSGLSEGSVIELSKMAGEPMEIYVNGTLVALGETVTINERFGIRLTDVVSNIGI